MTDTINEITARLGEAAADLLEQMGKQAGAERREMMAAAVNDGCHLEVSVAIPGGAVEIRLRTPEGVTAELGKIRFDPATVN